MGEPKALLMPTRHKKQKTVERTEHPAAQALGMEELEKQLVNARKMETIGTLVSGLVHEFNDIFTPLLGFAELAREGTAEGSELRHNVDMVIKAGGRAKKLVKQMLGFTKLSGQTLVPTDMADVLERELTQLSGTISPCVTVVKDFERHGACVLADTTKVGQLFTNLVDNALEAMRDTGGTLTLNLSLVEFSPREMLKYPELRSSSCVRLFVKDTGEGIPPENIHRIFDPFFTTKKFGEASGVGLSVVQGIVRALGGAIIVHSEYGHGSEFVVLLPRHQEVSRLHVAKHAGTTGAKPTETTTSTAITQHALARVLCVDETSEDSVDSRYLFEESGFQVVTTASPAEAIEMFRGAPDSYDILVTDIRLQGMDAYVLIKEVQRVNPDIPVVIRVSEKEHITPEKAREFSGFTYVMKPVDRIHLADAIELALGKKDDSPAMVPPPEAVRADGPAVTPHRPAEDDEHIVLRRRPSADAKRILFIDEDSMICSFFKTALATENYVVDTAESSSSAFTLFKEKAYDIIVIDYNLTDVSSMELLRNFKADHPKTEIIVTASAPDLKDAVSMIKFGAFDFLAKPFSKRDLASAIESAAKQHTMRLSLNAVSLENYHNGFRVIRTLGAGSMGIVQLVEKNNVFYAMKILNTFGGEGTRQSNLKRFLREAKILSQLEHPGIVRIFDSGVLPERNIPYIVMEYLPGQLLTERIGDASLSLAQKTKIIMNIADVLDFLHSKKILHRDIKPGNVILVDGVNVKLTDFGIAHRMDSSTTVTQTLMGSPAYMAPERFGGVGELDHRSDIFSLGVLAYELLCGRRPFVGDNMVEVITAVQTREPAALREVLIGIPIDLEEVVMRMLKKKPEERYQRAGQIIRDLSQVRF